MSEKVALFLESRNFNPPRNAMLSEIGRHLTMQRECVLLIDSINWQTAACIAKQIPLELSTQIRFYMPTEDSKLPLPLQANEANIVYTDGRWNSGHRNPFIRAVHSNHRAMLEDCDQALLWRITGVSALGPLPGFLSYIHDWGKVLGKRVSVFNPNTPTREFTLRVDVRVGAPAENLSKVDPLTFAEGVAELPA